MTTPRFLQIHTLHSYPAALLNRDDSGLAKRMRFGDAVRTRISSQCLKRHWRVAQDEFALSGIAGSTSALRSRKHRRTEGNRTSKGRRRHCRRGADGSRGSFQRWRLRRQRHVGIGPPAAAAGFARSGIPERQGRCYLRRLSQRRLKRPRLPLPICSIPGGARATTFVPSENQRRSPPGWKARCLAAWLPRTLGPILTLPSTWPTPSPSIGRRAESDYFSVVDDLQRDDEDAGAAHIGDMELTAGLFYGYVRGGRAGVGFQPGGLPGRGLAGCGPGVGRTGGAQPDSSDRHG